MTAGVRFDFQRLRRLQSQIALASARAVNKTAISVRAVAAREVSKDMGIRVGDAKKAIALGRATAREPAATLTAKGARLPLIQFGASGPEPSRGKGRGVSYRIRGQRRRLPHAFIATMRSGHRSVFKRLRTTRLPIVELLGPSIPRVFVRGSITAAMRAKYAETMPENLRREIAFAVSRI